ncbi:MAG: excinuclease ABC subunit UvrC [Flavobacteriales bacterium]|nr:excinuclease ABC subunit UvrC [Flavobacteriales bacterium]
MKKDLELQLKTLPSEPGIYQYYDKNNKILYVGKAKNIKKRVLQYFQKDNLNGKTRVLVSKIHHIKTVVVESEFDALLLENNLIKENKPKYNILLKDDKTFPWVCIKKERFPRVFYTRRKINDGSEYFGPYVNVKNIKYVLEMIRSLYPIRTCSLDLSQEKIKSKNYKVCLEYHIGNCLGACENLQTEQDYLKDISEVREILKGNFQFPIENFTQQMNTYAQQLEYEKAQQIKEKLNSLETYQSKSLVVHPTINQVDVFSITSDETAGFVNYMKINKGAIVQSFTTEYRKILDESDDEILKKSIIDIRTNFGSTSKEIFTSIELDLEIPNVNLIFPKIGDKKKIVELSLKNAKQYRIEQLKQVKIVDPERHTNRIMQEMKANLHLPKEPRYIECFDNSNIQGTNPASACVVFKNGKPAKKEYRIFNIKTVEGPDDFASMQEVIYRRYKRLQEEKQDFPDLIIIDGGKGQLSSAYKSLKELNLENEISIIGIAKRLEEIYFPHDSIPLYLDKTSETLKIIQQARDEAHRFGLAHHRNRRSKSAFNSELEDIPGFGEKTIEKLLKEFKSFKRIKEAPILEVQKIIGKRKTDILMNYLNK